MSNTQCFKYIILKNKMSVKTITISIIVQYIYEFKFTTTNSKFVYICW